MTPSSNEAIGLQQSLGCERSSTYFFFFSREMARSFAKGLVKPRLSLSGEMSFTKVCVTAPYSCLLFIIILPYKQTFTYKV